MTGMAKQLAQHCELAERNEGAIRLRLAPLHKHLLGKAQQDKLQSELQNHFGRPLRLDIDVAEPATETPAERSRNASASARKRPSRRSSRIPSCATWWTCSTPASTNRR
jgi:DNA polymerase-3 subunit gamma/tau